MANTVHNTTGGNPNPLPTGSVTVVGNGRPVTCNPRQAVASMAPSVAQAVATNTQGATAQRQALVAAAVALRGQGLPWAAVGQALGWGNPNKARSGAGAARKAVAQGLRATAPVRQAGQRGTSAAQAAMPLAGPAHATQGSTQAAHSAPQAGPNGCTATTQAGQPCKGKAGSNGRCPAHNKAA